MDHHYGLKQSVHQEQKLVMNQAMRHAFDVLQLPIEELSEWLEKEIEKNPLIEIVSPASHDISYLPAPQSKLDYLFGEIDSHFDLAIERKIAHFIAGSLDEKGFFTCSIEESASFLNVEKPLIKQVLHRFQRMELIGLGCQGPKEALLVQLEMKGLTDSPLYLIITDHYLDLLHGRLKKLCKVFKLSISELKALIELKLRPLNPFPGHFFLSEYNPSITPDISVEKHGESWEIEINERGLPTFTVSENYLDTPDLKRHEIDYMRRHISEGKWLSNILDQRKATLERIAQYILKKQVDFFEGTIQTPNPMTMSEIANVIEKSESTISRAIAGKYISSPLGVMKLRTFFTQGIQTTDGIVSNQKAKDLLKKLIQQEEKPLSDELLSQLIKNQGISCSRRTVTKYRKQLNILPASKRVKWN